MNRQLGLKLLDNYKRKFFLKKEFKLKYLNFNSNQILNPIEKEYAKFLKKNISNVFKKTKLNNKCLISGRNYNINTNLKLSRFEFRTHLKKNLYSNFKKN